MDEPGTSPPSKDKVDVDPLKKFSQDAIHRQKPNLSVPPLYSPRAASPLRRVSSHVSARPAISSEVAAAVDVPTISFASASEPSSPTTSISSMSDIFDSENSDIHKALSMLKWHRDNSDPSVSNDFAFILKVMTRALGSKSADIVQNELSNRISRRLSSMSVTSESDSQVADWLSFSYLRVDTRKKAGNSSRLSDIVERRESSTASPISISKIISPPDADALETVLMKLNEWDFDIFALDAVSNHRPLMCVAFSLFTEFGLLGEFKIPTTHFLNFVSEIEDKYNPKLTYHNSIHAADVLQSVGHFVRYKKMSNSMSSLDVLAAFVASAIHDVDHPGTTNSFQVTSSSPLAITYNDRSVLENHHLACAFQILARPSCNIFVGMEPAKKKEARDLIIEMVLATDMAQHVRQVANFQAATEQSQLKGEAWPSGNQEDRILLLNTLVHCADLGNPSKPVETYVKWTGRLMEEFFHQGDSEKALGLQISPMMDRSKAEVERSQVGFIDCVVYPMYEGWINYLEEGEEILTQLRENRNYWAAHVVKSEVDPKGDAHGTGDSSDRADGCASEEVVFDALEEAVSGDAADETS